MSRWHVSMVSVDCLLLWLHLYTSSSPLVATKQMSEFLVEYLPIFGAKFFLQQKISYWKTLIGILFKKSKRPPKSQNINWYQNINRSNLYKWKIMQLFGLSICWFFYKNFGFGKFVFDLPNIRPFWPEVFGFS